ncbi:Copalyl diphosphate synthase [Cytospora mali]|uniref:Copalyl diphosphate synthase n=1 Tax=Cytospora mali TaxID=578113 RepID=A0A194UY94_CYTMA|nr:Copalyl diphosphate synthase [Valsa mali var. pyri (nom. inval.)]
MDASLHEQARALLATLAVQCSAGRGLGSMSASVYDTAWLSMVQKPAASGTAVTWLFPECFEFLLTQQLPCGAWESYATPVDGILNTAAALLSLKRHLRAQPGHHGWTSRCQKAEAALKQLFDSWDMDSADQVGFEILIISLISLLEQEGVFINLPRTSALRAARDAKLTKLPPYTLYQTPSTLYHSLEAFIGHIDFDRVRRWREPNGSMMGSPASTAAYLMNSSTWDDEAEAYLTNVLRRAKKVGREGVPCAWPTTIFEVGWVVTTLASAGVPIGEMEAEAFGQLLQGTLAKQKGLLGFAPGSFPDVDDTSKGLETLHYIGQTGSVKSLIQTYEADGHFITYPGERNPSFSANCNVLILLLTREDRAQHITQIMKAAQFLTSQVFGGHVKEKWHLHELYWMMLLARAYELLFQHSEIATEVFEHHTSLREDIPMVSLHILMRILRTQESNGSWGGVCEVTSYGVLALVSLEKLPWVQQLDKGRIISSIALGKSFLHSNRSEWARGHYLWVEKVTYSSNVLSEAYCLAAAFASMPSTVEFGSGVSSRSRALLVPEKMLLGMRKAGNLLARTPLFCNGEPYALRAAEMQACFAMQALQREPPDDIFPRTAKGTDKYIFLIPLVLTACAELHGCSVSLSVLYEMMLLSVLNYHADEYMEGVVERYFGDNLDAIRSVVRQLFTEFHPGAQVGVAKGCTKSAKTSHELQGPNGSLNNLDRKPVDQDLSGGPEDRPSTGDVRIVLRRFVARILRHPAVLSSPSGLQTRLAFELETFLLAHITHSQDNYRLRAQWKINGDSSLHPQRSDTRAYAQGSPGTQYREPGRTFYHWVRSTSADHTSCPFSFVFFNCLVHDAAAASSDTSQPNHGGILASARTAYLAEDACRHLASLCRMYNDIGSVARDADERALNSVNFPEFFFRAAGTATAAPTTTVHESAKAELMWIAEYERRGLEMAMKLLEEELGRGELMGALYLFIDVTDLYGQIYVLEDVGTRTQ